MEEALFTFFSVVMDFQEYYTRRKVSAELDKEAVAITSIYQKAERCFQI
jgi:hypothetical protein